MGKHGWVVPLCREVAFFILGRGIYFGGGRKKDRETALVSETSALQGWKEHANPSSLISLHNYGLGDSAGQLSSLNPHSWASRLSNVQWGLGPVSDK